MDLETSFLASNFCSALCSLHKCCLGFFLYQRLRNILLASIFSNLPEDRSGDSKDKEFSLSDDHTH